MSTRETIETFQSDSPVGTEFLRLYHRLAQGHGPESGARSYLITSATVGEGKSTVSSFLALTLATIKKRTLLIDGDLRRPTLHSTFNLYLEDGVTEVANGELPQARAYKETRWPNLHVMTAGRLQRSPSSYYQEGHVKRILDQARPRFDFIILDCAPIMPVVDPLVISADVTGVLVVVKAGATHRELVKEATDSLIRSQAPIAGILLNNFMGVLPYHYSYRYAYEYSGGSEKPEA